MKTVRLLLNEVAEFKTYLELRKQLKKYWELLQKNQEKLDSLNLRWRPSFKTYLIETELVEWTVAFPIALN